MKISRDNKNREEKNRYDGGCEGRTYLWKLQKYWKDKNEERKKFHDRETTKPELSCENYRNKILI